MPQNPRPKQIDSAQGHTVNVLGQDIRIIISSRDTEGAFSVFEAHMRPLAGPPLHRHPEHDEYWYIVDGEYLFVLDGEEIYASAGSTVFAPRGSVHTFQNIGNTTGHTVTTVVPGGVDLFFEDLERVAPRGVRPDPVKMRPVFERYGQELLGPPLSAVATPSAAD